MKQNLKRLVLSGLSTVCVALLVSCGDSSSSSGAGITAVKVFGDSLTDVGVFKDLGIAEFSVQDSSDPNIVWTERIAATYGIKAPTGGGSQCNYFVFTGTTFTTNSVAGCTNYGIGGGRINNAMQAESGGDASPVSITTQMAMAAAAGYKSSDLVLIDGGGNDAADLVGAFLTAPADGGVSLAKTLATLLPATTYGPLLANQNIAAAGVAYMQALANKMSASVQTNVLDKGASKVVVLNMPAILQTPRFQMTMQGVQAQAGAVATAQYKAMFEAWLQAYNAQLQSKLGSDGRVAIVDFYTSFNNQINNPAQYALTNVTTPACPVVGQDAVTKLPNYNFATCTAAALSAQQPNNPNWWKTYAFSDGFHPTPYGYQLLAQVVTERLVQKSW